MIDQIKGLKFKDTQNNLYYNGYNRAIDDVINIIITITNTSDDPIELRDMLDANELKYRQYTDVDTSK